MGAYVGLSSRFYREAFKGSLRETIKEPFKEPLQEPLITSRKGALK